MVETGMLGKTTLLTGDSFDTNYGPAGEEVVGSRYIPSYMPPQIRDFGHVSCYGLAQVKMQSILHGHGQCYADARLFDCPLLSKKTRSSPAYLGTAAGIEQWIV
jgi:hypothetical protein